MVFALTFGCFSEWSEEGFQLHSFACEYLRVSVCRSCLTDGYNLSEIQLCDELHGPCRWDTYTNNELLESFSFISSVRKHIILVENPSTHLELPKNLYSQTLFSKLRFLLLLGGGKN